MNFNILSASDVSNIVKPAKGKISIFTENGVLSAIDSDNSKFKIMTSAHVINDYAIPKNSMTNDKTYNYLSSSSSVFNDNFSYLCFSD